MKSFGNSFISILKVLIWPIIFVIGQFLVPVCYTLFFNAQEMDKLKILYPNESVIQIEERWNQFMTTVDYQNALANFLNNNMLVMLLIIFALFLPILYFIYKKGKEKQKNKFTGISFLKIALLGIAFASTYNIIVYQLNQWIPITDIFQTTNIPIWISILASGILGPILEELIFRGIVYEKLKKTFSMLPSIIISSVIFGLFHSSIIQALFAFAFSFLLIYVYEKYKSIKAPILLHCFGNTSVVLLVPILLKNNILINLGLLLLGIVILFLFFKKIKKDVYSLQKRLE